MSDTKQEMVEDIREIRGEDCAILRLVLKGKWLFATAETKGATDGSK